MKKIYLIFVWSSNGLTMKVVVLNNNIVWGGAYRAAINTHNSFLTVGLESHFLEYVNKNRQFNRYRAITRHYLDRLPLRSYGNRSTPISFSTGRAGINLSRFHQIHEADIINLHWITGGFISLNVLKWLIDLGKPIVWTIHDFWAITPVSIRRRSINPLSWSLLR